MFLTSTDDSSIDLQFSSCLKKSKIFLKTYERLSSWQFSSSGIKQFPISSTTLWNKFVKTKVKKFGGKQITSIHFLRWDSLENSDDLHFRPAKWTRSNRKLSRYCRSNIPDPLLRINLNSRGLWNFLICWSFQVFTFHFLLIQVANQSIDADGHIFNLIECQHFDFIQTLFQQS